MKLVISILIWILFVYLKYLEEKGVLDSISFKFLWLRQLPEINLDFIWIIIKKLLLIPEYIFDYINSWLSKINNWKLYYPNIFINVFIFYFLFSFIVLKISSNFYWKDALIVKLILIILLLILVYFI